MSMWEPRSSHLYVCTGLRVCEWLRVGAGTPCLSELCKLPFLININIENTFIAMQIII